MIQLSNNTKYPDIAFEQENIQLSALHSVVILPPLSKIEMGKPLVVEGKTTVKSHSLFDDIRKQALEIEIRNLLIHKERFSKSSTYFAKLSGIYEVYGNKLEAINYAKKASELNHTPDIVYRLGESFLQDGKNEEAFSIFLELKNKKHIESYLRLAESAINNQKFEEADELINEALSLDSLDWRLRLLAGTLAMTRKEFQQAVRHYRVAIDSKPNSSILKHNLAIPYYLLGNTKRALKEAQKAILTNPFNTQALILLADITLKEDNKKSLKNIIKLQYYLESYLSLMPKENSLIGRLADVYLLQNKIKEGIELLSNKKSELKNPMIVNNLGVFWSSKESKVASKYYLDAIHMAGGFDVASQNRGASFAALNLANLLINKKQYKHAEEILLAFTQGASDLKYLEDEVLCRVPVALVIAYINLNKIKMAINLAENLLKNSNIHVVARLDLLAALLTYHSLVSFDHNLSLKYATEAVNIAINSKNEITPDSLNLAMNNMAYALIENKKLEEASHWINQLRTDLSSAEYIYATKGLFSLQSGNFEKAKELYLKAISITDSSRKDAFRMKMNYELGRYSFENSDYSHAKIYLKKVVQSKQAKDIWSLNELQFKASEFFGTIQRISFKA